MKAHIYALLFISHTAVQLTHAQPMPFQQHPSTNQQWELVSALSDEFDSDTLDATRWDIHHHPWGDRAWRSHNVSQSDGNVRIQADYHPHRGKNNNRYYYTTGMLQSRQQITYGYVEARIKAADIFPGFTTAFWLYSNGSRNPQFPHITYAEIDIVELLQGLWNRETRKNNKPNYIDCNLHTREIQNGVEIWRRPEQWPEICENHYEAPFDPRDGFHIYACENTPEKITWFIDGIPVASVTNHNWHLPMTLTINLEPRPPLIRWGKPGEQDRVPVRRASTSKGFPITAEVDYIRVWKPLEK